MKSNRNVALLIAIVAPAVIGGWLGWNYPIFHFPVLSQQATTTDK